jgi:hypothetical protein
MYVSVKRDGIWEVGKLWQERNGKLGLDLTLQYQTLFKAYTLNLVRDGHFTSLDMSLFGSGILRYFPGT